MPTSKIHKKSEPRATVIRARTMLPGIAANISTPVSVPVIQRKLGCACDGGCPKCKAANRTGMPDRLKTGLEALSGMDLSAIRIHPESSKPAQQNALAYTQGHDIHIGPGQEKYLPHEGWHVVQQRQGRVLPTIQAKGASINDDVTLEQEADVMGAKALQHATQSHKAAPMHADDFYTRRQPMDRARLFAGENASSGTMPVQRKMALHSMKDAKAFRFYLTANDAKNFKLKKQGKSRSVFIVKKPTSKIDDAFRFNILKTIIKHPTDKLVVRESKLDKKTPRHDLYKNGKPVKKAVRTTLRHMTRSLLGAAGVHMPSRTIALAADPVYTGPVSSVSNESWILYSTPGSLAHEFGHAFLSYSGTPFGHGKNIPKSAGIKDPSGKIFQGTTDFFIRNIVSEKFAALEMFDPQALHFSPTVRRSWPEPPHFKFTFKGTWLEYKAKYPSAEISQEKKGKRNKTKRTLIICIPKKGNFCPTF